MTNVIKQPGESWRTRGFRAGMNAYPMFFGTGGRVRYIAADWREVRLTLGLNPFTRNYVGTIFGGSMFAASDPFLMLMLHHVMGSDYVVWDKAARIRFRRPGRERLAMTLRVDEPLVTDIRATVATDYKWTRWLALHWLDARGEVACEIERELYVADKAWYNARQAERRGKDG